MTAKPSELKKLVELLDQEHDSAEALAKQVFDLVEETVFNRQQYVVVVVHPTLNGGMAQVVGPYNTKGQLLKDYEKRIHAYDNQSYALMAQLRTPSSIITE